MDFAFLHGGDQASWVWGAVVAAMKAQSSPQPNRFCLLDVPGCGTKRSRDTSGIAFPDIAAELVADVAAAGLSDAVLVGHSQAGNVMPAMLAQSSGLFRRAVYVSCSAPDPGLGVAESTFALHGRQDTNIGRWVADGTVPSIELFRHMFCNDMSRAEGDAFLALLGKDKWPDSAYTWTAWNYDDMPAVPASYVVCLQDAILPPAAQYKFADRFRAERRPRIDAAHQAMTTRPHGLAEILLHEAGL